MLQQSSPHDPRRPTGHNHIVQRRARRWRPVEGRPSPRSAPQHRLAELNGKSKITQVDELAIRQAVVFVPTEAIEQQELSSDSEGVLVTQQWLMSMKIHLSIIASDWHTMSYEVGTAGFEPAISCSRSQNRIAKDRSLTDLRVRACVMSNSCHSLPAFIRISLVLRWL
jgi:hypothetical protein